MFRSRHWLGLALLGIMLATPAPAHAQRGTRSKAAQAAARGEMLAQACFACHGPRGASQAAGIPSIGGQGAVYLVSSLMRFRENDRPVSIMNRLAKGYTEAEIMDIAQYISNQPFQRNEQLTDKTKVKMGARAYRAVCNECHPNGGRESSDPDYPIVAGQRLLYMQMQMHEIYTTGKRRVDSKFTGMLDKLTKDEIDAVLHYFASQQ